MVKKLLLDLKRLADPKKAKLLQKFFKTRKGEYGEGDIFLGIMVPQQRMLVKKYWKNINLPEIKKLLQSPIHEQRLVALLILVQKFQHAADKNTQSKIFKFYLQNTKYVNNWDLVDLTAPKIIGAYLRNRDKSILFKLAKSKNLWERRMSVLSTFNFIYYKDPLWAFRIISILQSDKHDLIHKATGWMLREIGKRCDQRLLTAYLDKNFKIMPRTMLRYSLERLPKSLKIKYLAR